MKIEASEIFCPDCDSNYNLAWSKEDDTMYVVCGCGEAEPVVDFHDRFTDEYSAGADVRGYQ